ncbi:MAG: hypothetical protein PF542_05040 [Nanoarchaeota archaeon]|jgi:flagellin-like protein|nr:hypothetical protein [Nanoarchaeota archaeon]
MNKKGLSQIVTTLILILLILVAVGGIWAVVNNFITKGAGKIGTDQFTMSLTLKSAKINYTTGMAEVKVRRNAGEGQLTGLKFIVEDTRNSDIYEETFERFPELAERTFDLNLTFSEFLVMNDIYKISIAPMFLGPTGAANVGSVAGSISGLNEGVDFGNGTEEIPEPPAPTVCVNDSDCGIDYFVEEYPRTCNDANTHVEQYEMVFTCSPFGTCFSDDTTKAIVEECINGDICSNGVCIAEPINCTPETIVDTCGVDGLVPMLLECHPTLNATVQDYQTYTCDAGVCDSGITSVIVENCTDGDECFNGECFTPLECIDNADCPLGEICDAGNCTAELVINSGGIASAWPPGVAEYFESSNLPAEVGEVLPGYFIIFPGGAETRCLTIRDFIVQSGVSYIRLNGAPTNVTAEDSYQVWETDYICSQI